VALYNSADAMIANAACSISVEADAGVLSVAGVSTRREDLDTWIAARVVKCEPS